LTGIQRNYCCGVVVEDGCGVVVEGGEEGLELGLDAGLPDAGLPKVGLPTGLEVLLAGWPTVPVLPPLTLCISESGS
jgi:hypothetical protein